VIRIAITQAAFEAIAATLALGSVAYEPTVDEGDLRYIWLEARWLDRLKSYRGPGESYSDVILRLKWNGPNAPVARGLIVDLVRWFIRQLNGPPVDVAAIGIEPDCLDKPFPSSFVGRFP
jgi:hypothetical protein